MPWVNLSLGIFFSVLGEITTCLSLGDRPVNFPVLTINVPPMPNSPSFPLTACSIKLGSVKL